VDEVVGNSLRAGDKVAQLPDIRQWEASSQMTDCNDWQRAKPLSPEQLRIIYEHQAATAHPILAKLALLRLQLLDRNAAS
jgi:hypothetical protein